MLIFYDYLIAVVPLCLIKASIGKEGCEKLFKISFLLRIYKKMLNCNRTDRKIQISNLRTKILSLKLVIDVLKESPTDACSADTFFL